MGVYIPNMEKPKSCIECKLHKTYTKDEYFWQGSDYCGALGRYLNKGKFELDPFKSTLPDCPLIDIVTCKECKWWEKFEGGIWEEVEGEYGFCTLKVDAYKHFGEDNFCSYGERRTDEDS